MGVENIITFDAHDARVQNATPLHGFETIQPAYQFIKGLLRNVKGLEIDSDHMMVISPASPLIGESNIKLIQFSIFIAGYDTLDTLNRIEQIADGSIMI